VRGLFSQCISAFDVSVTTCAIPAIGSRATIFSGSAVESGVDGLPAAPIRSGTCAASVSDLIYHHSDPPSGGIIILIGQVMNGVGAMPLPVTYI
jgi:hypothetical protein